MKIGTIIKYYRTKNKITQEQLANSICSITHLSKIENNHYSGDKKTIKLLLDKLEVDASIDEKYYNELQISLNKLHKEIVYFNDYGIERLWNRVEELIKKIPYTDLNNLFELIRLRFLLYKRELKVAKQQISLLNKLKQTFSKEEVYLFDYFTSLYNFYNQDYRIALIKLNQLMENNLIKRYLIYSEVNYIIGLIYSIFGHHNESMNFGNKALDLYKNQDNIIRVIHSKMLLAITYNNLKMFEQSKNLYEDILRNSKIIKDDNLYNQNLFNYALLLKKKGQFEEALNIYKECLEKLNSNIEDSLIVYLGLIEIHFELNLFNDATKKYLGDFLSLSAGYPNKKYKKIAIFYSKLSENKESGYLYLKDQLIPYLNEKGFINQAKFYAEKLIEYLDKKSKSEAAIIAYDYKYLFR